MQYDLTALREGVQKLCRKYNKNEAEMFRVFDSNNDKILDFKEFDKMMNVLGLKLTN
jgi:Ca2+-binding EF-hand superfamily protein